MEGEPLVVEVVQESVALHGAALTAEETKRIKGMTDSIVALENKVEKVKTVVQMRLGTNLRLTEANGPSVLSPRCYRTAIQFLMDPAPLMLFRSDAS